ncbi:hypothetical protein A2W24_07045 [Microgenomates group bacterium RBG_16_45_19]|nr:MAG: hypothetical protein A2W24_07045 [Microgenomates group bacterium RBG_16_45_19]
MTTSRLALLIGITFFYLYASGTAPVNVGFGDSDVLIAAGAYGGVAHPPGYPLYLSGVYLATHLPLPVSLAQRAHLFSALLYALSLSFIFLSVHRLLRHVPLTPRLSRFTSHCLSLVATCVLGLMYPFWLYAQVAEKYALNLVLATLIIYLSLKLITAAKVSSTRYYLFAFVTGLALVSHLSLWLLTPLILVTWISRWPRPGHLPIFSLLSLLLGLALPLLLLWQLNLRPSPPVSWHFPATAAGLWRQALMLDYFSQPQTSLPPDRPEALVHYSRYLILSFGFLPSLLGLVGGLSLFSQRSPLPRQLRIWLLCFWLPVLALSLIMPWPGTLAQQAVVARQYLITYLTLPFLLSLGLIYLKRWLSPLSLSLVLILVLIWRLMTVYPQISLAQDTAMAQSYRDLLNQLPLDSLLVCTADVSCFALLFQQAIYHTRPDVIVVPEAYQFVALKLDRQPQLKGFDYPQNPFVLLDYISWNLKSRPVYVLDLQPEYYRLLGLNRGLFYLTPQGYAARLTTSPASPAATLYPYSDYLLTTHYPTIDPVRLQRLAGTAQRHLINATVNPAELDLAKSLFARLPSPPSPATIVPPPPETAPLNPLNQTFDEVLKNPRDPEPRRRYAQSLQLTGQTALAELELTNALKLATPSSLPVF